MTGDQHYAEAERCLAKAVEDAKADQPNRSAWWQQRAQIHATLALAWYQAAYASQSATV